MTANKTLSAIILAKTDSQENFNMTLECASTLLQQANTDNFDIQVTIVESEQTSKYTYPAHIQVIRPCEQFNFHKFLNVGIAHTHADWFLLCNNDLLFQRNWLLEIENVMAKRPDISSFSPISDTCVDQQRLTSKRNKSLILGYDRRKQLSGWCILVRDEALKTIGGLDERFDFYFADDDYALSLRRHNLLHALVTTSHVLHLEDQKTSIRSNNSWTPNAHTTVPEILKKKRYRWIAQNPKMINGFKSYTGKWGDIRWIRVKRLVHDVIFLHLGIPYLSRYLFKPRG